MRILSIDVGACNLAYCEIEYLPYNDVPFYIYRWNNIDLTDDKIRCHDCKTLGCYYYYDLNNKRGLCKLHAQTHIDKYDNSTNDNYLKLYRVLNSKDMTSMEYTEKMCEYFDDIDFSEVEYVIIEEQVQPKSKFKSKSRSYTSMVTRSFLLLSYFAVKYNRISHKNTKLVDSLIVSNKGKLSIYDGPYISCNLSNSTQRNKYLAVKQAEYFMKCNRVTNHYTFMYNLDTYFHLNKKNNDLADCMLQGMWFMITKLTVRLSTSELKKHEENNASLNLNFGDIIEIDNENKNDNEINNDNSCDNKSSCVLNLNFNIDIDNHKIIIGNDILQNTKNLASYKKINQDKFLNKNIIKYRKICARKKSHKSTKYTLSNIKYEIKKNRNNYHDNDILLSSIEYYFGDNKEFLIL
jgi:hypothetical protein